MLLNVIMAAHQGRIRWGKRNTPFLGEISAANFITGNALASAIGLTAGTAQNSNEPWLHFELDGKTLYVAKKTFRHTVSWNQIHATGAVYGTRTVVIQGKTYKVRLLKGANSNPYTGVSGWDHPGAHGSEWNRLMYRISGKPFANASNTLASEGIEEGDWAQYSEADLNITVGNGRYSWCQETPISNSANRVVRGSTGVSRLFLTSASASGSDYGWRPVLELVE